MIPLTFAEFQASKKSITPEEYRSVDPDVCDGADEILLYNDSLFIARTGDLYSCPIEREEYQGKTLIEIERLLYSFYLDNNP